MQSMPLSTWFPSRLFNYV